MVLAPDFSRGQTPLAMEATLSRVGLSHTLRCDAKQAERRFAEFDRFIASVRHLTLGDFLPQQFTKGVQPRYIETLEPDGIPVISTLAIQDLTVRKELCRFIMESDYETIPEARRPQLGDVLLTVDGGTSIGKSVVFDFSDEYAVDSHVAMLRPAGMAPRTLMHLLASPLGQLQFQRAESGASGQTGVTEEDIRRFKFPDIGMTELESLVEELERARQEATKRAEQARLELATAWASFRDALVARSDEV